MKSKPSLRKARKTSSAELRGRPSLSAAIVIGAYRRTSLLFCLGIHRRFACQSRAILKLIDLRGEHMTCK